MRFVLLLALAACSDYSLTGQKDTPEGEDSDDPVVDTVDTDVDDEEDCAEIVVPDAYDADLDEDCLGTVPEEIVDPWNVDIEWQWKSGGMGVIVMPAVGQLTDDDRDGAVTASDDPDVAVSLWSGGLVALNGDGTVIFNVTGYNGNAGVAIADVTGDGEPEVIAYGTDGRIAAVDAGGARVWQTDYVALSYYPQPTVADLDNDGHAEVIFDGVVVDGETGKIEANFVSSVSTAWRTPIVGDLDLDGQREIVLGEGVFDPTGRRLWGVPSTGSGNFAAIADVDGDPEGEVLFVSGSELLIYDSDGSAILRQGILGTNPGPPCVADFDGDGGVDIAIPANYQISLHHMDGTRAWAAPMVDSSGLAGCSGYDVDGDGAYEVLFADEESLRIYDGKTGDTLFEDFSHDSGTLWEYPVVADVDNDGSAEILIASNQYHGGGYLGVTAFGHAGSGWPKSGPTWGIHDFAVTNLEPDGSVPVGEIPSWQVNNVFRARPSVDKPGRAELYLETGDMCVTTCEDGGRVYIPWQVGNRGGLDHDGVEVALIRVKGGVETELTRDPTDALPMGAAPAGGVFDVGVKRLAGSEAYILRIESGAYDECVPGDEEIRVDWTACE